MSSLLRYIAQDAMDMYYGDYQGDQFFDKEDFVRYCGDTVSDLILQEYRTMRAENRSERKDEVIALSAEWMYDETVEVKDCEGELVAKLKYTVMSFPFDRQLTCLQDVIALKPKKLSLERGNVEEEWSYEYLPATDKIFWLPQPSKDNSTSIKFFNKGLNSLSVIKARYVPSPHADMLIPDAIRNYVKTNTVMNMKQIEAGVIIDKTNDGNSNKVMETEVNKFSLKG